jgi:hypothetical protein
MHNVIRPYSLHNLKIFFPGMFIYATFYVGQVKVVEYASIVWNSIMAADASKPDCIRRKFASVRLFVSFPPSRSIHL